MKDEINIYLDKLILDKNKPLRIGSEDFGYCKTLDDIRDKLYHYGDSKHASEIRFFNLISNEINYCYDSKKQKEDELIYKYLGEKRDLNSKVKIKIYMTETSTFNKTIEIYKNELPAQMHELEKTIKKYEAEKKNKKKNNIINFIIFSILSIVLSTIMIVEFSTGSATSMIVFSLVITLLNYFIIYVLFN